MNYFCCSVVKFYFMFVITNWTCNTLPWILSRTLRKIDPRGLGIKFPDLDNTLEPTINIFCVPLRLFNVLASGFCLLTVTLEWRFGASDCVSDSLSALLTADWSFGSAIIKTYWLEESNNQEKYRLWARSLCSWITHNSLTHVERCLIRLLSFDSVWFNNATNEMILLNFPLYAQYIFYWINQLLHQ